MSAYGHGAQLLRGSPAPHHNVRFRRGGHHGCDAGRINQRIPEHIRNKGWEDVRQGVQALLASVIVFFEKFLGKRGNDF